MKGKTVAITGGTSGIGEVAAEATLSRLGRSGPGVVHSVYFADLKRLADMRRVAAEIANREPPIDVLINNAGAKSRVAP